MSNLMGKLLRPLALVGALSLASLVGCSAPGDPSTPGPTTPSSGQPPVEPSMVIYPGPNTNQANPYTGSAQPRRSNSIIIYDGANDETGFTIERATGNGTFNFLTTLPANTQIYTDYNVTASTPYTYRIKATNNSGSSDWYSQTATSVGPQVGAIDVYANADAFINSNYPNQNFGNLNYVELWSNSNNSGNGTSSAFISFQIPNNLPSWSTGFNSASLYLHDASGNGTYNNPIEIHASLITSPWTELGINWGTSFSSIPTNADTYASPDSSHHLQTITLDVSQIGSYWYSGSQNYGIFLYADQATTPNAMWNFYSKEGYPAGSARLRVEYNW